MSIFNTTGTISLFAKDPLAILPGSTFRRSHHGFHLIATIIEQIEQRPYYEIVNEFLREAGLKFAEMDIDTKLFPRRVTHYKPEGNATEGTLTYVREPITDNIRPFPHWAAEAVIAQPEDLHMFSQFVIQIYNQNGKQNTTYIRKESLEEMWDYKTIVGHFKDVTMTVNGTEIKRIQHYYVMGWERYDFPEVPELPYVSRLSMLFHTSGMDSSSAIMAIFPDKNFAVSLAANLGRVDGLLPEFAVNAFQILYDPKQNDNL